MHLNLNLKTSSFPLIKLFLSSRLYIPLNLWTPLSQWHRKGALRALLTLSASAPVISTSVFPSVYLNCHSSLFPSGPRNNPWDSGRYNLCINNLPLKKSRLQCHCHSRSPKPGLNPAHKRSISYFLCLVDKMDQLLYAGWLFCHALFLLLSLKPD